MKSDSDLALDRGDHVWWNDEVGRATILRNLALAIHPECCPVLDASVRRPKGDNTMCSREQRSGRRLA
jgi:hypothetical protein